MGKGQLYLIDVRKDLEFLDKICGRVHSRLCVFCNCILQSACDQQQVDWSLL